MDIKVNGQVAYSQIVNLTAGQDTQQDFNFKELQNQQSKKQAEAAKKNEEAKAKFSAMKQHFDAGNAALDQAKQTRAQIDKMPKDQQAAAQGQLDQADDHGRYRLMPRLNKQPRPIRTGISFWPG